MDRAPGGVRHLAAVVLFAGVGNASLVCSPAIASQLAIALNYSPRQIGIYFFVEYAGYVLAGLVGRRLLPSMDWRRVAALSTVGVLAGSLVSVAALGAFPILLCVRLVTATCGALLSLIAMASANESPNSTRVLSFYIMGQIMTGALGLATLPFLFALFGLKAFFLVIAAASILASPAIRWLYRGKTREHETTSSAVVLSRTILMLRFPAVLLFYVVVGGVWTFAGQIGRGSGLSAVTVGTIRSASTVAGVTGTVVAAFLGRRQNIQWPILTAYAALITAILLLLHIAGAWWFFFGMIMFKAAWTFVIPSMLTVIARLDRDGAILADVTLIIGVGLAIGPLIASQLVQISSGFGPMLIMELTLMAVSCGSIFTMARAVAPQPGQA
jgi:predicted MFS family arabinose efflux permease